MRYFQYTVTCTKTVVFNAINQMKAPLLMVLFFVNKTHLFQLLIRIHKWILINLDLQIGSIRKKLDIRHSHIFLFFHSNQNHPIFPFFSINSSS